MMRAGGRTPPHIIFLRTCILALLATLFLQARCIQQNYGYLSHQTPWDANHAFISLAQNPAKTAGHKRYDTDKLIVPVPIPRTPSQPDRSLDLLALQRLPPASRNPQSIGSLLSPLSTNAAGTAQPTDSDSTLVEPVSLSRTTKDAQAAHTSAVSEAVPFRLRLSASSAVSKHEQHAALTPVRLPQTVDSDPLGVLYHQRLQTRAKNTKAVAAKPVESEKFELLSPEAIPATSKGSEKPASENSENLAAPLDLPRGETSSAKLDDVFQPLKLDREQPVGELVPVRPGVARPPAEDLVTPVKLRHKFSSHDAGLLEPEILPNIKSHTQDLTLVQPIPLKSNPKLDEDVFAPIKLEPQAKPSDLLSAVHIHGVPVDSLDWALLSPTVIPRGLDSNTVGILKHQLKQGTQVLINTPNPSLKRPKLSAVEQYLQSIRGGGKLGSRELFARGGHLFFPSRLRRYLKLLVGSTDAKRIRKKPYHRKHATEDLVLKYAGRPKYEMTRLNRYIDSKRKNKLREKLLSSRRKQQSDRLLRTQRIIESKRATAVDSASSKNDRQNKPKKKLTSPHQVAKKKSDKVSKKSVPNKIKSPKKGIKKANTAKRSSKQPKNPHKTSQKKRKTPPKPKPNAKPTAKAKHPAPKSTQLKKPTDNQKSLARTPEPPTSPAAAPAPSFWSKLWPFSSSHTEAPTARSSITNTTITKVKIDKSDEEEDQEIAGDPRERMLRRIREAVKVKHQHLKEELSEFERRSREPIKTPDIWALSI